MIGCSVFANVRAAVRAAKLANLPCNAPIKYTGILLNPSCKEVDGFCSVRIISGSEEMATIRFTTYEARRTACLVCLRASTSAKKSSYSVNYKVAPLELLAKEVVYRTNRH